MFMIMFGLGMLGIVTGGFRLISCWLMEKVKNDRFSPHRKKVWRNVCLHYGVTFLLFYLSFRM